MFEKKISAIIWNRLPIKFPTKIFLKKIGCNSWNLYYEDVLIKSWEKRPHSRWVISAIQISSIIPEKYAQKWIDDNIETFSLISNQAKVPVKLRRLRQNPFGHASMNQEQLLLNIKSAQMEYLFKQGLSLDEVLINDTPLCLLDTRDLENLQVQIDALLEK